MPDEPLTVIVPVGHCWRPFEHKRHLYGPNDDARLCDGSPLVIDTLSTKPAHPTEEP